MTGVSVADVVLTQTVCHGTRFFPGLGGEWVGARGPDGPLLRPFGLREGLVPRQTGPDHFSPDEAEDLTNRGGPVSRVLFLEGLLEKGHSL